MTASAAIDLALTEYAAPRCVGVVWSSRSLQGTRGCCRFDGERREIHIHPLARRDDWRTYATLLHELGHVYEMPSQDELVEVRLACLFGMVSMYPLGIEVRAWQWALQHARVWNAPCDRILRTSLYSYTRWIANGHAATVAVRALSASRAQAITQATA